MYLTTKVITPEEAREVLDKHNSGNRNISNIAISNYLSDMKSGKWVQDNPNGTICFGTNGELLDGQHRLAALAEFGEPLSFIVAYEVDDSVFNVMDCGKTRKAGDFIDKPSPRNVAAAAARMCNIDKGVRPDKRSGGRNEKITERVTRSDVVVRANNDEMCYELYKIGNRLSNSVSSSINTTDCVAWLYSEYLIGNLTDAISAANEIIEKKTISAISYESALLRAKLERKYKSDWKIGSLRLFMKHSQKGGKIYLNKSLIHFSYLCKELKSSMEEKESVM